MLAYGNIVLKVGTDWLDYLPPLRPYTIRLRFKTGITPEFIKGTGVCIDTTRNIWDLTYNNSNWYSLLWRQYDLLEVISGNTTGVTSMWNIFGDCMSLKKVALFDTSSCTTLSHMFSGCSALTSVPLYDTSNATELDGMFYNCASITTIPQYDTSLCTNFAVMFALCTALTEIPLLNTSLATRTEDMFNECVSLKHIPNLNLPLVERVDRMCRNCYNVESGALALYTQFSSLEVEPVHDTEVFKNCGRDTVTGAAELAQIPSDWGGTGE